MDCTDSRHPPLPKKKNVLKLLNVNDIVNIFQFETDLSLIIITMASNFIGNHYFTFKYDLCNNYPDSYLFKPGHAVSVKQVIQRILRSFGHCQSKEEYTGNPGFRPK